MVRLFWFLLLVWTTYGLYEDQAGKSDWNRKNVGVPNWSVYHAKRLFVSTEDGVIAALNARTGAIEWRHLLSKNGNGQLTDALNVYKKFILTLSDGGKYLRMWQMGDGALVWDSATFAMPTSATTSDIANIDALGKVAMVISPRHVTVLSHNLVYFFGTGNGVLEWQLSSDDMIEPIGTDSDISDAVMGVVLQTLHVLKDGRVVVFGLIADKVGGLTALLVTHLDVFEEAVETITYDIPSGLTDDPWALGVETLATVDDDERLVAVVSDVRGQHHAIFDLATTTWSVFNSLEGDSATSAASLQPLQGSGQRILTQAREDSSTAAFVAVVSSDDVVSLSKLMVSPSGSSMGASLIPSDSTRTKVLVGVASQASSSCKTEDTSTSGCSNMRMATLVVDSELVKSGVQALNFLDEVVLPDEHGPLRGTFPHGVLKRDGGIEYRMLVTTEDDSVIFLDPTKGAALWLREEALASIESMAFFKTLTTLADDKAVIAAKAVNGAYTDRLALQRQHLLNTLRSFVAPGVLEKGLDGFSAEMRHKMGFDQLAVCRTRSGRLVGLNLQDGSIRWSRLVRKGYKVVVTRPDAIAGLRPEVMLMRSESVGSTSITYVDALDGNVVQEAAVPIVVTQLSPLPFTDKAHRNVFLAISGHENEHTACLVSDTPESRAATSELSNRLFFHVIDQKTGTLESRLVQVEQGKVTSGSMCYPSFPVATAVVAPESEETIVDVVYRSNSDLVNTPAQVLGDDSLLLKYLNSHLAAVVTVTKPITHENKGKNSVARRSDVTEGSAASSSTLFVSLVDTVAARVLHRVKHSTASGPTHITMSENWIVYSYWNTKAHRTELSTLSLYEGIIDRFGLNPFKVPEQDATFDSFTAPAPVVMQRTYIFPKAIAALSATTTARGITSKNVLIALESGQVMSLHRRFIDPRRPNGSPTAAEKGEGLMQYSHILPVMPLEMVTNNETALGLKDLYVTPAIIESTCLMFAVGIDVFFAHTSPSKAFDLLATDFNRPMLLTLLGGLATALVVVSRLEANKRLRDAWR